ncbi:MAG TPA: lytic transglycosylase domain-containing protein [Rhizomicrobium sp.]|jgi:soluble lytic murein transglycosylase|nr:lytic transglycosylase domain-containing protein [Rhizomicrobium sp.]
MTFRRAVLFTAATALAALAAYAQTTLPNGLTQLGGVIMMQPIPDGSTDNGFQVDRERRPSPVHALSPTDHDVFGRAFDAADRGDWTAARALAGQGHDATAIRLITWRYLLDKNSGAAFADLDGFLRNNPNWPLRDTLLARAEVAMDANLAPAGVLAWYGGRAPVTGLGMVRLGDAMLATGRVEAGRDMVRRGWISGAFQPDQELAIVRKDGGLFTPEIDRARLENLISRDDAIAAGRELSRVDDDVQRLGRARLAFRSSRAAGERLAAALPAELANDPELLFDRARAARRANDNAAAAALLQRGSLKSFAASHPARWWGEVNLVARALVASGDYRSAYGIVSDTGLASGTEFSESEFMAGWIALRFLKNPNQALVHFRKLETGVSRPISLARARYWKGRCYEALRDNANAFAQYKLAAEAPESFYGQMALARIEPVPVLHINDVQVDAGGVAGDFEKDDVVRAIRVLADLGQVNILRIFALREQELHPDARRVKYLAQTLSELGFREIAVRVAKTASYAGTTFLAYTHPVIPLPAYPGPGTAPEPAYVLGLIRQETEFDPDAVSKAGARGLMQLMPGSARGDASRAGLIWRPNDLTGDPNYNIQLGMVEFAGDVGDWNGSLVLAIASYNAGPGNVKKWLAANGDPRNPATDPIDWIEEIPFNETRNYVQRVLENAQIYRNRLSGRDQQTRILNDLYAPLAPPLKPVSPYPG